MCDIDDESRDSQVIAMKRNDLISQITFKYSQSRDTVTRQSEYEDFMPEKFHSPIPIHKSKSVTVTDHCFKAKINHSSVGTSLLTDPRTL